MLKKARCFHRAQKRRRTFGTPPLKYNTFIIHHIHPGKGETSAEIVWVTQCLTSE